MGAQREHLTQAKRSSIRIVLPPADSFQDTISFMRARMFVYFVYYCIPNTVTVPGPY